MVLPVTTTLIVDIVCRRFEVLKLPYGDNQRADLIRGSSTITLARKVSTSSNILLSYITRQFGSLLAIVLSLTLK